MNRILEDLWYNYYISTHTEQSPEEKETLDELILLEGKLQKSLSEEQMDIYKNYEACTMKISCISEKEAFIKGACFATQYLFEALRKTTEQCYDMNAFFY